MKKQKNPHDTTFKNLAREKVFAQAFVQQYFSANELAVIDLDSMELWNASYMGEEDDEYHSDVVYQVQTKKGLGYIVFLFEHQSKPEEMMPLRTLEYSVFLMRQHLQQGHSKLPVVIPIVFYHGKESPYPYSTDIFDCFENPAVAKQYYMQPFKLIDVTVIPDEELKNNIITAPLQIIMKHIRDKDLLPYFIFLANEGVLEENAHFDGGKLLISVVTM